MGLWPTSQRLEEADGLLKKASLRLKENKNAIDSANLDMAQGLLEIARDYRDGLEDKSVFARYQQAQEYLEKVKETHNRIEQLTLGLS